MIRVVDTSVLIDHLRGDQRATEVLRAASDAGDELWSVTPVRTEILAGALPDERDRIDLLLGQLRWLDVTMELADTAGRIAQPFVRSHPGIDTVDYLLAATTEHLGAELLTLNVRHFPMLSGL
ncbi:MAG TPA: type II toxin-antitoxin system VapC family toxin, partial [Candidatus Limnocylindrales bacterium]|nr:type II toxin-antitoxin system VapC family toxin [Candidatus Limnocylindrales bacterium]